jgi:cold shock CspA family protein
MSVVTKTGRVKMIGDTFAFLTDEPDGHDIFVPRSVLDQAALRLQRGDRVAYDATPAPRGPRATRISLAD